MIAKFLQDCGLHKDTDINMLREVIQKHLEYGTIITLYDEVGLYAVARFNIADKVAVILDVAVRKDKRYKNILVELIKEGMLHFPGCEYLKFERCIKGKPFKIIPIKRFL
jgi:hypothetical protein